MTAPSGANARAPDPNPTRPRSTSPNPPSNVPAPPANSPASTASPSSSCSAPPPPQPTPRPNGSPTGSPPAPKKPRKNRRKSKRPSKPPPTPPHKPNASPTAGKKVTAGANDLNTFLEDLIRQGLVHARSEDTPFTQQAARLVDAQAPGLARLLREAADTLTSGDGWERRTLARLGQLHLLLQAVHRFDKLPPLLQAEVRALVGIPLREEDLAASGAEPLADTFSVLGQRTDSDDKLRTQRTWLLGRSSGRYALILEFAFGNAPLKSTLLPATTFSGSLLFYPSSYPLRAAIANRNTTLAPLAAPDAGAYPTLAVALDAYSDALAKNPFLPAFPIALQNVRPLKRDRTLLLDSQNAALPLNFKSAPGRSWELLALAGDQPLTLFGEFDGHTLTPFSAFIEGQHHALC